MKTTDLTIAAPCQADWRTMTPADGGRFCGDCKKVVRDLSKMKEHDARALLHGAQNGELCVRYLFDRHGKIFFAGDQPAPLLPASFLQRAKRVALAAAAVALPLSLQACSVFTDDSNAHADDEYDRMMGGMTAPENPIPPPGDGGADGDASHPTSDGGDAAPKTDGGDAGPDATADAETPI